jgi:transcriptional regulator with XRE-family HTH domain
MTEDRPGWARRITREREARGWSQAEAVRALRVHSPGTLPAEGNMLRQWKRWEAGEVMPSEFYRQIHRGHLRHRHTLDVPGRSPT